MVERLAHHAKRFGCGHIKIQRLEAIVPNREAEEG
jgi:hypothetical protein